MKILTVTKRDDTISLKTLRSTNLIPGNVYKKEMENINVVLQENEVRSAWKDINDKKEFTLDIEGDKKTVILQDIQVHVVSGQILHMDFLVK